MRMGDTFGGLLLVRGEGHKVQRMVEVEGGGGKPVGDGFALRKERQT